MELDEKEKKSKSGVFRRLVSMRDHNLMWLKI